MDVQRREFKNGLVVATEVMPYLHSVSVGVWLKGGSRFETDDDAGISHFIEHLLFKGTKTRSAAAIAKAIDSVGGQLNAFTDKEYVCFYARILDRHLPFAFGLLSDIALNPTFPAEEMEREREVIFEEISMVEDSPQELIQDIYMESLWKDHPLGRPVSGTRDSVGRITRERVRRFFDRHYTARNTVISIAGNIRHEDACKLAARHFEGLTAGKPLDPGPAPAFRAARVARRKPNLEQTHICIGAKCPPMASEDRYGAQLLSNILGGGVSSRLFQSIREKRGLAYSIYSGLNLYCDAGTIFIYAAAAPDKTARVVELIVNEVARMCRQLVPAHEIRRAKENMLGSIMLSLESSASRMTQLAQQLIYFDRFYTLEEVVREVENVTAGDIRRLANEIFKRRTLALTLLGSQDRRDLEAAKLRV
jgi:predicted Zn-dependent peptidase